MESIITPEYTLGVSGAPRVHGVYPDVAMRTYYVMYARSSVMHTIMVSGDVLSNMGTQMVYTPPEMLYSGYHHDDDHRISGSKEVIPTS